MINSSQSTSLLPNQFVVTVAAISAGGTVERAAEKLDEKGEKMQKKAQQNQGKEQMKSPENRKL